MRTATGFLDPRARVEFGALFHDGGDHIVGGVICLAFEIGEDFAAKRLGRIGGNDAIQRGFKHFQQPGAGFFSSG